MQSTQRPFEPPVLLVIDGSASITINDIEAAANFIATRGLSASHWIRVKQALEVAEKNLGAVAKARKAFHDAAQEDGMTR